MKIHLSNKRFDRKPTKDEARIITNTITREECEIDIKEFAKAVGEDGRTFTPALFHGRRSKDDFKSQQVFVLDFDDGIGPKEFFMRAEKYEIKPGASVLVGTAIGGMISTTPIGLTKVIGPV